MKLHFSKKQSIYNVFKTIKKIPTYKSVLISFVPDHPIYEHTWWAQQLVETIQQYNLDVIVVVHNQEEKAFFTQAGIATQMKHKNIFHKAIQSVHNLVFTTQKLHTDLIFKKSYISYLVIISELGVIITILYFFR